MTILKQNKSYFIILIIVSIYVLYHLTFIGWNESPFFWAAFIGWLGMLAVLYTAIKRSLNGKIGKLENMFVIIGVILSISSMFYLAFITFKSILDWYFSYIN